MQVFTIAGIPIRFTLGFLLLVGYVIYARSPLSLEHALGFVVAIATSVLIHELGHGLMARRYKLAPTIELHFWGGLCYHQRARKDSHDVAIIAGGPLLQIAAGGLLWLVATLVPGMQGYSTFETASKAMEVGVWTFGYTVVYYFVVISLVWGALNLLTPIWPLDGGQLFRMLLVRFVKPAAKAERIVHAVSIATSVVVIALAFGVLGMPILGILGITWVIENVRAYSGGNPVPIRVRSELADRLLAEAKVAAAAGEWHEARRLAFQARDEKTVTDDQLAAIFEMLTVASAELKDWHEALAWSPRAPRTPAAFAARLLALAGLAKRDEARAELAASDAPRLDPELMARVVAAIDGNAR